MSAHYDTYDYPSYWIGREYEHESETLAINSFLSKIPKIRTIVDIGAGYGRLTPSYFYRANKIILTDPSASLLKIAKKKYKDEKITFLISNLEELPNKLGRNCADLIVIVRVLHHINDLDSALKIFKKISKKGSFLILEFANKRHLKAIIAQIIKGNFTFPLDIFPKDIRSKKNIKKSTIPFFNYHPDAISEKLRRVGYSIIETRSVSNIRNSFFKSFLPKEVLIFFEKYLQRILAPISFGPSIFILAKDTRK